MTKRMFSVNLGSQTFTRMTDRNYTHVVLVKDEDKSTWSAYSWASSLKLAERKVTQAKKYAKNREVKLVNVPACEV